MNLPLPSDVNVAISKVFRRAFQAGQRESKKEMGKAKRVLAAKHAAQSRAIRQHHADAELALKKREAEREAEMAERRWRLLMGNR